MGAQGHTSPGGIGYYPRGYLVPSSPWGTGRNAPYGRGLKVRSYWDSSVNATVDGLSAEARFDLTDAQLGTEPEDHSWIQFTDGVRLVRFTFDRAGDGVPGASGNVDQVIDVDISAEVLVDAEAVLIKLRNAINSAGSFAASASVAASPGSADINISADEPGAFLNRTILLSDDVAGQPATGLDRTQGSGGGGFHYGVNPEPARPAVLGRGRGLIAQRAQSFYLYERWLKA